VYRRRWTHLLAHLRQFVSETARIAIESVRIFETTVRSHPLADVVCRPASDACDAVELCPGEAGECDDDAALPDGDPCDDGMCIAGASEAGVLAQPWDRAETSDRDTA
jgi:hypothetical protein